MTLYLMPMMTYGNQKRNAPLGLSYENLYCALRKTSGTV